MQTHARKMLVIIRQAALEKHWSATRAVSVRRLHHRGVRGGGERATGGALERTARSEMKVICDKAVPRSSPSTPFAYGAN